MITRKDFLVGAGAMAATAGAIDGASIGVSGRARGLLGGAFMGCMLAAQGGGAEEDFTEFRIRIPTDNRYINFANAQGFANLPADLRVDWGDGDRDTIDSWMTTGSTFSTYASTASSSTFILGHTYVSAGDYTIKMFGNVTLTNPSPTVGTKIGMADTVISYKCKRINYWGTTSVLLGNLLPSLGYNLLDTLDFSQCYEDPPSATLRFPAYTLGSSSSTATFTIPKRYCKMCRNVGCLTPAFCQNNTAIRIMEFPDRTMAQIRAMKTSAASTATLWDFRNFPTTCEIVCTDGTIKYANGVWTDLPNN